MIDFRFVAVPVLMFLMAAPAFGQDQPLLRYAGEKGKAIPYEVEIVADRGDVVETLKGTISLTLQSQQGPQLNVTYQGGLAKTEKAKQSRSSGPRFGPPGFRGPPRIPSPFSRPTFAGLSQTTNQLTVDQTGNVLSMKGDSQLPFLIGNLSILFFEALPAEPRSSWQNSSGITITEEGDRSGPPFFRPRPFDQPETERTSAGSESYSYKITGVQDDIVSIDKTYELNSPRTGQDDSHYTIKGKGVWKFDRKLGMPVSLEFKQDLTVTSGNTTTTIPVTLNYRRLSEEEWNKIVADREQHAEEAQARAADAQRQRTAPLSDEERQKWLKELQEENVAKLTGTLIRLQQRTPPEPDAEIGARIRELTSHSNISVSQMAERALPKWEKDASPSTTASRPGRATSRGNADAPTPAANEFTRTWSDRTGRFKVEADFLRIENNQVVLKRKDGREVKVPLSRLSAADQEAAKTMSEKLRDNPFE